ncbi:MAG: DUF1232 domain-containing protein [Erysipelotrichaceae bacterium]|jgi:uncharacterized membrane protein YkvA (DUF1232 family)|nr:DUF1232 domain-containing protein [Erysipelotrichaceae bacterium]
MENEVINVEKAKEILDGGLDKANEIIKNNEQISKLMDEVQAKVDKVPLLRDAIKDLPVMASMVKSYVKKEYTTVTPKVIATIVSAFIYLVKRKDILPDSIPILGQLDDIAVIALALKFIEPELKEYLNWKNTAAAKTETTEA